MAKLMDEGNDSLVNVVITITIYKDPWGRLVRYVSLQLQIDAKFMHVLFEKSSIDSIISCTNERATRTARGIPTRSLARGEGMIRVIRFDSIRFDSYSYYF